MLLKLLYILHLFRNKKLVISSKNIKYLVDICKFDSVKYVRVTYIYCSIYKIAKLKCIQNLKCINGSKN